MKNILPAIFITTALVFATQPGYASSTPQGVCAKEGVIAKCDTDKPVKSPKPQHVKRSKITNHRGKNIDPITTCSIDAKTPCTAKRPQK